MDDADEIALLMAAHRLTTPVQCSCGFRETDNHAGTWEAHLDAVLAPLVEQAKREAAAEALREAADELTTAHLDGWINLRRGIALWLRGRAERVARGEGGGR